VSLPFAVVSEAPADFRTATELADRELVDAIEWLDEEGLEYQRTWLQSSPTGEPLTWKKLKQLARDAGLYPSGFIDGEPAQPDANAARRAIGYLVKVYPALAGIVLIRDQDDQPERRRGLEQARDDHDGQEPIVIGLAVVERESWVLAGFDPADDDDEETARHAAERRTLGFDPRMRSEELTACKDDAAPRSPKRVLAVLCPTAKREARCWRETPLATLRARGTNNGLAAYLDEVRARLAPLIGHTA